jgi:hypothetical protein
VISSITLHQILRHAFAAVVGIAEIILSRSKPLFRSLAEIIKLLIGKKRTTKAN